jgi:valyl-tRNA synthetase
MNEVVSIIGSIILIIEDNIIDFKFRTDCIKIIVIHDHNDLLIEILKEDDLKMI